jgi:exonuclease SbcC
VDVAHELDEILQNLQQFLQVILLAQGVSRGSCSPTARRQSLLRRLFGTGRFEDYQARFDERRRASEQALGAGRATVVARVEQAEHLVVENELTGPGSGAEVIPADADASIDARLDALRRARAGGLPG